MKAESWKPEVQRDANNKFPLNTSWGDSDPREHSENDQPEDYGHDVSGIKNPDQGESSAMDLALEGNKFPREKGHDSLSPEEAQLS